MRAFDYFVTLWIAIIAYYTFNFIYICYINTVLSSLTNTKSSPFFFSFVLACALSHFIFSKCHRHQISLTQVSARVYSKRKHVDARKLQNLKKKCPKIFNGYSPSIDFREIDTRKKTKIGSNRKWWRVYQISNAKTIYSNHLSLRKKCVPYHLISCA